MHVIFMQILQNVSMVLAKDQPQLGWGPKEGVFRSGKRTTGSQLRVQADRQPYILLLLTLQTALCRYLLALESAPDSFLLETALCSRQPSLHKTALSCHHGDGL